MEISFTSAPGFSPTTMTGATGMDQTPTPVIGFIVPGGPVRTDFTAIDGTGMKRTLSMSSPGPDLPSPLASVTELVCFLWPNTVLPPDHGVLLYWQITAAVAPQSPQQPPSSQPVASTGFELLGSLTPTTGESSKVFQTGWATHEQLLDIMNRNIPVMITFAFSIEPMSNIQNLEPPEHRIAANRMFVAQKIASDLFRYMRSFDTGTGSNNQHMVVPTNVFDRWLQRFENRFRRDPNFFLKAQEDE